MTSLEQRLENPDYKEWVKASICLSFVKTGLEEFADQMSRSFHQNVLRELRDTGNPSSNGICRHATLWKGRFSCCSSCQGYVDEINRQNMMSFKFQQGNWDNSDIHLWPSDSWEMAKVFMNRGQKAIQRTPADTDLSGILNFIDHCIIAKKNIVGVYNISKVRDSRNRVVHSAAMTLSHKDFMDFTDTMIDLLEDPGPLGKMQDAKEAAVNIREVQSADFCIFKESEFKVLATRTEALNVKLRLLQQDIMNVKTEAKKSTETLKKLDSSDKKVDQFANEIETAKQNHKEIQTSIAQLRTMFAEDEEVRERMQNRIEHLEKSSDAFESLLAAAAKTIEGICSKLDSLECRVNHQSELGSILVSCQETLSSRQDTLEQRGNLLEEKLFGLQAASTHFSTTGKSFNKEITKLQSCLIDEYKRLGFDIPLSPVYVGLDDVVPRINVDAVYTDLMIVKEEGKNEIPLFSHHEIFYSKEQRNRTVFIKGEAGVGKTTWCMRILQAWVRMRDKITRDHSVAKKTSKRCLNKIDTDLQDALSLFDFLFFVPLRYVEDKFAIKDILFSSSLERLSSLSDTVRHVLHSLSEKVLILLDGVDEYAHHLSFVGLNQCTVIMTTRPWKYDLFCSQNRTNRADIVLKIKGLAESGIEKFTRNVCDAVNDSMFKNTVPADESKVGRKAVHLKKEGFLEHINSFDMTESVRNPLVLTIMLENYSTNVTCSPSLTNSLINLVGAIILRGEAKLSDLETSRLSILKSEWSSKNNYSILFAENESISAYSELLQKISKLAFEGIIDSKSGQSLNFSENQLKQFVCSDELHICYKYGLLTRSKSLPSLMSGMKICISFYHKLIQEFFCALWIVISDQALDRFKTYLCSISEVIEMENVTLFVCGLSSHVGSELTKHFIDLCEIEPSVQELRYIRLRTVSLPKELLTFSEIVLKCQKEVSLRGKPAEPLYVSDICLHSISLSFDFLLKLLTTSTHCLKSLFLQSLYIPFVKWQKLFEIVTAAIELQTLIIEIPSAFLETNASNLPPSKLDLSRHQRLRNCYVIGKERNSPSPLLPLMTGFASSTNIMNLRLGYLSPECCNAVLEVLPKLENLECLVMNTMTFTGGDLILQSSKLQTLQLREIHLGVACLVLDAVQKLQVIDIQQMKMNNLGWTGLFIQIGKQVDLSTLFMENVHCPMELLDLQNCKKLETVRLYDFMAHLRTNECRELRILDLVKVKMPSDVIWCRIFTQMKLENLRELKLCQLDLENADICFDSSSKLEKLTISNVNLGPKEGLKKCMFSDASAAWQKFLSTLPRSSLQEISLCNLDIGRTVIKFETCKCLKFLFLEKVKMCKESYRNVRLSISNMLSLKTVHIQDLIVDGKIKTMK